MLVNLTLQIKQPGEFQSNLKDLCHGLNNEAPQGTYFSCIYWTNNNTSQLLTLSHAPIHDLTANTDLLSSFLSDIVYLQ